MKEYICIHGCVEIFSTAPFNIEQKSTFMYIIYVVLYVIAPRFAFIQKIKRLFQK